MSEEKLFENKTTLNKALFLDGAKIWAKNSAFLKKYKIFYACLISICALVLLWSCLIGDNDTIVLVLFALLICIACCFISFLFYPHILTNTVIKNQRCTFGLERTLDFYDDRLEMSTSQSNLIIPFYMIDFASETKSAFCIIFENQIICISKNGFTVGNASDFGDFIRAKVNFK